MKNSLRKTSQYTVFLYLLGWLVEDGPFEMHTVNYEEFVEGHVSGESKFTFGGWIR